MPGNREAKIGGDTQGEKLMGGQMK